MGSLDYFKIYSDHSPEHNLIHRLLNNNHSMALQDLAILSPMTPQVDTDQLLQT